MPSTIIQPLTEADLAVATEIAHWSKLSLTINRLLWNDWPASDAQKSLVGGAISGSLRNSSGRSLKAVDEATGEILGTLMLAPRRSQKEAPAAAAVDAGDEPQPVDGEKQEQPLKLPPELNMTILNMVEATVSEIQEAMKGVDYVEVVFLVVKQGHRNRGIGRQLMGAAFEFAKSEGLPLYTTSEPAALAFFEKLGFKQTKHADMDLAPHAPPYTGFGLFRLTGIFWSLDS